MAPIVAHGKGETLDTCLISGNGRKSIFNISSFAAPRIYGTNVAVVSSRNIFLKKVCVKAIFVNKKHFYKLEKNEIKSI